MEEKIEVYILTFHVRFDLTSFFNLSSASWNIARQQTG